ncbi:hypothetical protein AVEN_56297-1 [Araneus ventricosus]|uniref:Tc1-like transposase DDE domain-containing protein n=1 Tax=Araneus ventricosus TaxID=182803 RepID=A0A4Y2RRL7_ARAVE|nr:hypothetical protein AVEN_56297-1 [Araneus ventricosus]
MQPELGTRYRAPNIVERDHYRGCGLLVWAGITTNGRTDLYMFYGGSVTAVRYRDEILHPLVRPFIAAMGTDAIFMNDNARPHTALLVRSYPESDTIPLLAWHVISPDLNPIRECAGHVGKKNCRSQCAARHPPRAPTSRATRVDITAKTSDQRQYCQHAFPIAKHAFQLEGIIPVIQRVVPIAHSDYQFGLSRRDGRNMRFCLSLLYCLICGLVMPHLPRV